MKKVIAYIAMSVDGYVADNKGDVSWLNGDGSDSQNQGSYQAFIETIDTVIMGYRTYYQIVTELSPNSWPYQDSKTYVLTHNTMQDTDTTTFVSEDVTPLITRLKQEEGKNIWICGGANIIQQLHKKCLIDEYCLSIIPVILGSGISLFERTDFLQALKLKSTQSYNGVVDLIYEKR